MICLIMEEMQYLGINVAVKHLLNSNLSRTDPLKSKGPLGLCWVSSGLNSGTQGSLCFLKPFSNWKTQFFCYKNWNNRFDKLKKNSA